MGSGYYRSIFNGVFVALINRLKKSEESLQPVLSSWVYEIAIIKWDARGVDLPDPKPLDLEFHGEYKDINFQVHYKCRLQPTKLPETSSIMKVISGSRTQERTINKEPDAFLLSLLTSSPSCVEGDYLFPIRF